MTVESDSLAKLRRLTSTVKHFILHYLENKNEVSRQELESYVLNHLKTKRDGTIHHIQPIHSLAFVIGYKELEAEGRILINRDDTPFPMTDSKTKFLRR